MSADASLSEPGAKPRAVTLYHAARSLAVVSAVVAGVVIVALAAAWWSSRGALPTIPAALDAVMEEAKRAEDAATVALARQLDVLARQAYFSGIAFRRVGTGMLLLAVAVGLLSLRVMAVVRPTLPRPPAHDASTGERDAGLARGLIAGVGVVLLGVVLLFGVAPRLERLPDVGPATAPDADPTAGAIPHVVLPSPEALAAQWTAFRGYQGQGVARGRTAPATWDGAKALHIAWKARIPLSGMGSPVVWGDRVYLTGGSAERLQVYCYDLTSGEPVWTQDVQCENAGLLELSDDTGFAAPTPATDGVRLYVVFASGVVAAFSLEGKPLWTTDLGLPKIGYGYASSPLAHDGKLFVVFDTEEEMGVMALNAATGEEVWYAEREGDPSWTSPVLVADGERTLLVVAGAPQAGAYDAATGEVVWTVEGVKGEVAPSPAVADGLVVIAQDASDCLGLRLSDGEEVWRNGALDLPDVASPVAHDGRVYLASSAATLACVNLADGTPLWSMDLEDSCYASPVIVDGRLYVLEMSGRMLILDATVGEAKVLATCPLGEGAVATPAFVGDCLLIRGREHLYCIREGADDAL